MRSKRPNEPPLPDALGYLFTWTTYGTWLPGDERGWTHRGQGSMLPDDSRRRAAERVMKEDAILLNQEQRSLVEKTIRDHCDHRNWRLVALNCRSNHVHVIINCDVPPKEVMRQLKQWTTRRLNEQYTSRTWWSERGSHRYLRDQVSLEAATIYVCEAQDRK